MRVLPPREATPEQLKVVNDYRPGYTLIRGAAGSGKTTTALLRLAFLAERWSSRRRRLGLEDPVRILVLTYNRTLRGYIAELAEQQTIDVDDVTLEIDTFARWARRLLPNLEVLENGPRGARLSQLGRGIALEPRFLADEVDYILGRFLPDQLEDYLTCRREGRGRSPRVDAELRARLLEDVVYPYTEWKKTHGLSDWNDFAVELALNPQPVRYQIQIVDEAQDFSANQIRAVDSHHDADHSTTFVLDAVQRIYPRFFTWREAGIDIPGAGESFRLNDNFRNTREIAAFAAPLVRGMELTDDGTLPDFESTSRTGPLPQVLRGRFRGQLDHAVPQILEAVGAGESVALLHPLGGGWFDYTRNRLRDAGIQYSEITRRQEWPSGPENVALSTLHSAKGLEFDHVYILGLNAELLPHGEGERDTALENQRRLLAMAVARARQSLVLGVKPDEAASITEYFAPGSFEEILV